MVKWISPIVLAAVCFAAGYLLGRREKRPAAVEYGEVRYQTVAIERTRVDTVRVPIEIPVERVAIVREDSGCISRVASSGPNVLLTTRMFVPGRMAWAERQVLIRPPDHWFVESEVGLLGDKPWAQINVGRTFAHQRIALFTSAGTRGVGLGVRVRF